MWWYPSHFVCPLRTYLLLLVRLSLLYLKHSYLRSPENTEEGAEITQGLVM